MPPRAETVQELLAALPADRRRLIKAIRKVIRKDIDAPFEEGLQYGMLAYYLPHSKYPKGYHCDPKQPLPFASIASQKNHVGLYLFCIYCDPGELERFRKDWLASGKKLDMGKSCVRVKTLEDVPLDVVGRAFARITAEKFVAAYEKGLTASASGRKALKKRSAKKATPKKKARRSC